ncbi:MAG: mechanosensitive ion channel [Candidatus Bathyarchaeia archaeon]
MQVSDVNVFQLASAIIILSVAYISSKILARVLGKILDDTSTPDSTKKGIIKTVKYGIYFAGFFAVIHAFDIDLTSLVVGLGVFSIAVSFAMNNLIQNLVSGILIRADGVFRVGDEIKVQNLEGRILKVGMRSTLIESVDGDLIVIPNIIFTTNPVTRKKRI